MQQSNDGDRIEGKDYFKEDVLYYNGVVQVRISAAERLRATVQARLVQALQNDCLTPEVIEGAAEGAVTAAITTEAAEYSQPTIYTPPGNCTWAREAMAAAAAARAATDTATATPPPTAEGATPSQASAYTPY